ncbi:hypothetical protein TNIN_460001 [Trichonephila inaurata madagascariensis]|uniref:Uncharacterized protein n=1 Tax=Trichonephila inaurata madagascariensis TaxID=2747483 RepID=A0A8X6X8Y9_9ARAC|nr:hypothetical protein TNIN_460001 [Trichonephila inaurata madagascariensis]
MSTSNGSHHMLTLEVAVRLAKKGTCKLVGSFRIGLCSNCENNYSQNFVPLFYLTPSMGHFIKRRKYQDGTRLQSIVQPSSFLRPRFFSPSVFSPLVQSLPVWSPLSLPGPPLYIVGTLPDLVCIV